MGFWPAGEGLRGQFSGELKQMRKHLIDYVCVLFLLLNVHMYCGFSNGQVRGLACAGQRRLKSVFYHVMHPPSTIF